MFIDFKEVKALARFEKLIPYYKLEVEELHPGQMAGPCPFCGGCVDDPFRINFERQCYNCFACDGEKTGGNILDFIAEMEECDLRAAAVFLVETFELPITSKRRKKGKKAAKRSRKATGQKELPLPEESRSPKKAIEENIPLGFKLDLQTDHPWFEEQGISSEIIQLFGLGFCQKGVMKGRIAFPVNSPSGVLGYLGLWPGDDLPEGSAEWLFPKPHEFNPALEVYGFHECSEIASGGVEVMSCPLEVVKAACEGIASIHFLNGVATPHQLIKLATKFA